VYVTGKVAKGGVLQSEKPIRVLQAITLAVGLLEYAKKEEIVIIRSSGSVTKKIPFNYTEVAAGKSLIQDILLESGDVVVVQ
jgi:polysaccharide export outer membrane protein